MTVRYGKCHCGTIRFEFETELSDPVRCNCSFCERRGTVLQKEPSERFRLTGGRGQLARYGSREFSDHFFCKNCGTHAFTRSTRNNDNAVVVNIACLIDVDLATQRPRVFDGANLL